MNERQRQMIERLNDMYQSQSSEFKSCKDRTKKRLNKRWKKLINDFRDELLRMWELDAKRGRWQGKDGICVYNYGDGAFTIDIENIIYCVLCDVTREQYEEYQDYVRNASELDFIPLELHPWMRRNV